MNKSHLSLSRRAFSLMELIVVIAIIGIIAAFTVPQAGQILKGSTLTQGSTILTDQIRLAREYAVTKNCKIEVRFYQYGDPEVPGEMATNAATGQFRALQIFQVLPPLQDTSSVANQNGAGETMAPLDKVQMLPQGVIMNPTATYSTLITSLAYPNTASTPASSTGSGNLVSLPRGINFNYNYAAFRFLPDGSTTLPPTGLSWFVTLHNLNDRGFLQSGSIINYFTLQIDPVVGTTKSYRPQAG